MRYGLVPVEATTPGGNAWTSLVQRNQYSPQGVKQIRFRLATSGPFIDCSSIAIQAKLTNKSSSHGLVIIGPNLGTLVQEARVYLGSVEVERCQFYNRTEAMLQRLESSGKRVQIYDEGFGYSAGTHAGNDFSSAGIAANASKTVVWRPQALGICAQKNFIPSAFVSGGMIVELLLVNTTEEVCDGAHSTEWELSDVKLLVDVVSVDASLLTSMSKHMLSGGSLTLNMKSYNTVMYAVNSPSMQLLHTRAFTRLNAFFLTFYRSVAASANTKKVCNHFYLSPSGKDLSLQSQVGERSIPDHRIDNLGQFWHRFLHCVGLANSSSTCNITRGAYELDSFISATDLEAVPLQAHGSGMSTHNSQLTLDLRDLGTDSADLPTSAYLTCWYEALVTIEQDGVTLAI